MTTATGTLSQMLGVLVHIYNLQNTM